MDCDHWIGLLRDNKLRLSNYVSMLDSEAFGWNKHADTMNWLNGNTKLKNDWRPSDFLDGRKALTDSFNYCPECGEKLNWKLLKQSVSVPTKTPEPNEQ